MGEAASWGAIVRFVGRPMGYENQAYNFQRAAGGGEISDVKTPTDGRVAMSRTVKLSDQSELFLQTMETIKKVHGLKMEDFTSDELVALQTYEFSSDVDRSDLFSYKKSTTTLNRVLVMPLSIPVGIAPGVQSDASVAVLLEKVAQDRANEGWLFAKAKKKEDWDKTGGAEHTKGARGSTKGKHGKGQANKNRQREGSKGMSKPPNRRPEGHSGPWPPRK